MSKLTDKILHEALEYNHTDYGDAYDDNEYMLTKKLPFPTYHGTNETIAKKILQLGLKQGQFLSIYESEAEDYAIDKGEDNGEDGIILEVAPLPHGYLQWGEGEDEFIATYTIPPKFIKIKKRIKTTKVTDFTPDENGWVKQKYMIGLPKNPDKNDFE